MFSPRDLVVITCVLASSFLASAYPKPGGSYGYGGGYSRPVIHPVVTRVVRPVVAVRRVVQPVVTVRKVVQPVLSVRRVVSPVASGGSFGGGVYGGGVVGGLDIVEEDMVMDITVDMMVENIVASGRQYSIYEGNNNKRKLEVLIERIPPQRQ
ncbi:uncharacterized protein [Penaeus vannamei]|uniref:uncharacterized protein n=1 Tax=Penaeus vannamei TaxID=6689 RepID=UPI00387F6CAC